MAQPNFLSMLFGQQAAAALSPDEDELGPVLAPGQEGTPIGVTGSREPAPPPPTQPSASEIDQYLTMGLDNTEAIRQRDTALKAGEAESNRKGMFGVGGTLRDVLGVLGDAFLVQSGKDSLYAPTREKERFSDAMAGSSVNPMAAYERAMGVAPDPAMAFLKQEQTNASSMGNLGARRNEFSRDVLNDSRKALTGVAAQAFTSGDQAFQAQARQAIASQAQRLLEQGLIAPDDPLLSGDLRAIAGSGASVNQTLDRPIKVERNAIARGNLAERRRSVDIAARNARTAEERVNIYRQAFEERVEAGDIDEAMEFYKMLFPASSREEQSSRPAPPGSQVTSNRPIFRP